MQSEKRSQVRTVSGSMLVVAMFLITSGIPLFNSTATTDNFTVSADGGTYAVSLNISAFDRPDTYQNRIISINNLYLGPCDTMVKCANGDYLGFIGFGFHHANSAKDLEVYRSINNAFDWDDNGSVVSLADRDVAAHASGVTQTGRIFVFHSVYDFTNNTWPKMLASRYSDDNGSTWSVETNMTVPTLGGFVPLAGDPWGNMRIYGANRIGFFYYVDNQTDFALNLTQTRFCYSDNNGANWTHVVVGSNTPGPNVRTEIDSVYLGNNQIVALARKEAGTGPEQFRSLDNGLTWINDGAMPNALPPGQGGYMSTLKDNQGDLWVLAFINQGVNIDYSIAKGSELIANGASAWIDLRDTTVIMGDYPFALVDMGAVNTGFIMTEIEADANNEFVLIWNLTASITKRGTIDLPANIHPYISLILIMFGFIIAMPVIGFAVKAKENGASQKEFVEMVVTVVVSIILMSVLIALLGPS